MRDRVVCNIETEVLAFGHKGTTIVVEADVILDVPLLALTLSDVRVFD